MIMQVTEAKEVRERGMGEEWGGGGMGERD